MTGQPLERYRAVLEAIAAAACESFTSGPLSCYRSGRTEDARYLADRVCDPCRAYRALNPDPNGEPPAMTLAPLAVPLPQLRGDDSPDVVASLVVGHDLLLTAVRVTGSKETLAHIEVTATSHTYGTLGVLAVVTSEPALHAVLTEAAVTARLLWPEYVLCRGPVRG